METNFITIYLFCLQARMINFVTLLGNGVAISKYKIYNGFHKIKLIFEIAEPITVETVLKTTSINIYNNHNLIYL